MFSLFFVLLLAKLGAAVLYNDQFDLQLAGHNNVSNHLVPLAKNKEKAIGPFLLSDGVFIGDDSGFRIGNATIDQIDDTKTYMDFNFGWRHFVMAFGKIKFQGRTMTGLFKFKKTAFQCAHNLFQRNGACSLIINHFRFRVLDDVRMDSSVPKYDRVDISSIITKSLLPKINEYFKTIKPKYQALLEDLICRKIGQPKLQSFVMSGIAEFFNKS